MSPLTPQQPDSTHRVATSPHSLHHTLYFPIHTHLAPFASPHYVPHLRSRVASPHLILNRTIFTPHRYLYTVLYSHVNIIIFLFLTATYLAPFCTLTSLLTKTRLPSRHNSTPTINDSTAFQIKHIYHVARLTFSLISRVHNSDASC